ncbi:MAG: GAF domain-containing protein, partial [Planctomycetaceae bacterium]
MNEAERVALSNCDSEPVHIPGRIQSFGALLGFDLESGTVLHHSDNLGPEYLNDATSILGQPYEQIFNSNEIPHAIRGALGLPTIQTQRDRIGLFHLNDRPTDISVYTSANQAIVELEHDDSSRQRPQSAVTGVRSMLSALHSGDGLQTLLDSAVTVLRHLTGHDRIMAYRFMKNGDGEVAAESHGPGIEPFLGLRYPASDIPLQVRQIALRSRFRIIHDTRATPSALISQAGIPPLDLTYSQFRGVSPIHIEYLENMGVRSTMNVSIIVRGQLWGLFAFHSYRARRLSPDQRSLCELFGHIVSMQIQQEEEQERQRHRQTTTTTIASIRGTTRDPMGTVQANETQLKKVVNADRSAFFQYAEVCPSCDVPQNEAL